LRTQVISNFENRTNISGEAGITGNNQDPINWGPPTLIFSSGIASLSDAESAFDRNETNAVSSSISWNHGHHNVTLGGDFRRQEFNYFSQQDPRGTFTFTGVATGVSDFADFLEGIPDTSAIAYGNADKYLRQSAYDAYVTDGWRLRPELTINAGIRWEYGSPITELYGRLVNLDVVTGFSAVAPVLGSDPTGPNLQQSQDTLFSLAGDTGGKALLDCNDLTKGIVQAQQSISNYYILEYYTTNTALNGRFRHVKISLNPDVSAKLDYRQGYYAGKEFRLTNRVQQQRPNRSSPL
jgi:hypothetical protein